MKKMLSRITVLLVILGLVITGCKAAPPAPIPTKESMQPAASDVVLAMVERMNAGDVEGSLAYFADDAVAYIIGLPLTGIEVYAGKEEIRTLWQDSVANHFKWEVSITSSDGNLVNVSAKTWHDFTRNLEVAPLEYHDVYEVKDGRITTYGSTITADALARFKPAFAKVVPPAGPGTPSTEKPVSEMTVTVAGGRCKTENRAPLQAGEIKVTFEIKDQNKTRYALTIFTLDAEKDILDLMAATVGMPPSWADMLLFEEVDPGKSETYTFTVAKAPVYMVCWSKPPDLPIGNVGPIEVKE